MNDMDPLLHVLHIVDWILLFFWLFVLFYSLYKIPRLKKGLKEELKNPMKKNQKEEKRKRRKYEPNYADFFFFVTLNFLPVAVFGGIDEHSFPFYLASINIGLMFICFIVFWVGGKQLIKIEEENKKN